MWDSTRQVKKRYLTIWRNKFLTQDAKNLDDMIDGLRHAVETLEAMRADGVILDSEGGTADDYAHLVATDSEIAKKYDMREESEFLEEDREEEHEAE